MVSYIGTNEYNRVNMKNKNHLASNPVEREVNIFNSSGSAFGTSIFARRYLKDNPDCYDDYKTPREEFEKILAEQGFIGKFADKIKNMFPVLSLFGMYGSDKIEEILEKYENDCMPEEEAREAVRKYGLNQKILTEFLLNTEAFLVFLLIVLSIKMLGVQISIAVTVSCAVAVFVRVTAGMLENSQGKLPVSSYTDYENYEYDIGNNDYKLFLAEAA